MDCDTIFFWYSFSGSNKLRELFFLRPNVWNLFLSSATNDLSYNVTAVWLAICCLALSHRPEPAPVPETHSDPFSVRYIPCIGTGPSRSPSHGSHYPLPCSKGALWRLQSIAGQFRVSRRLSRIVFFWCLDKDQVLLFTSVSVFVLIKVIFGSRKTISPQSGELRMLFSILHWDVVEMTLLMQRLGGINNFSPTKTHIH